MPLALLALTLSAFAIGTTEFVIVGLIPTIGADLGVSLPSPAKPRAILDFESNIFVR
ncbi:MFS transporter [Burkholderia multivorans]|uniref:MFS transporter n=1 Tax=Burkholderia multivorans TaxID=87883 RepID=UPI000D002F23|nr:MFS transporter [Burkholderia multivorans]MBR8244719.1 MFS transporter [Burkholderia multivorans]MBU9375088.1 MFS transporter [Burkholderia multivorans]MBU9399208.1 MFS transporter [Burkholderia multivorans]MCO8647138.1 MFS transporter [Burkholderia multivorans]MDN7610578.1 MFS transporter [Burkholderia multivorans]